MWTDRNSSLVNRWSRTVNQRGRRCLRVAVSRPGPALSTCRCADIPSCAPGRFFYDHWCPLALDNFVRPEPKAGIAFRPTITSPRPGKRTENEFSLSVLGKSVLSRSAAAARPGAGQLRSANRDDCVPDLRIKLFQREKSSFNSRETAGRRTVRRNVYNLRPSVCPSRPLVVFRRRTLLRFETARSLRKGLSPACTAFPYSKPLHQWLRLLCPSADGRRGGNRISARPSIFLQGTEAGSLQLNAPFSSSYALGTSLNELAAETTSSADEPHAIPPMGRARRASFVRSVGDITGPWTMSVNQQVRASTKAGPDIPTHRDVRHRTRRAVHVISVLMRTSASA